MTPVRLRPDLRLPWQALAGFAALLYVLESALRGWDFRPTLLDGLVFGALTLILILRPLVQRLMRDDEEGQ
ncbi:MAG TPA: hypothetical protein VIL15_01130 [Coriobacteriia bacterium]